MRHFIDSFHLASACLHTRISINISSISHRCLVCSFLFSACAQQNYQRSSFSIRLTHLFRISDFNVLLSQMNICHMDVVSVEVFLLSFFRKLFFFLIVSATVFYPFVISSPYLLCIHSTYTNSLTKEVYRMAFFFHLYYIFYIAIIMIGMRGIRFRFRFHFRFFARYVLSFLFLFLSPSCRALLALSILSLFYFQKSLCNLFRQPPFITNEI